MIFFLYRMTNVILRSLHVPLFVTSLFWMLAYAVPLSRRPNCVIIHEPAWFDFTVVRHTGV